MIYLYSIFPILMIVAYTDFKERRIPNKLVFIIFLVGLIQLSILLITCSYQEFLIKVLGFFVPFILLLIIYFISPNLSGAGDLKLVSSLGLVVGLYNLALILAISVILGLIWVKVSKERFIPLGSILGLSIGIYLIIKKII